MRAKKEYLLVDGYNIIFGWDHLKKLADISLETARDKLLEILANYQGYKHVEIIIVFDAQKVKGGVGSVCRFGRVDVVYTSESETADAYIERVTESYTKNYRVRVATSDGLEQIIILGKGALRVSARELYLEVKSVEREIRSRISDIRPIKNNQLVDNLDLETAELLEKMRRQKKL